MKQPILREIVVLWLVTLLLIRVVVTIVESVGLHEVFLAAVPILFMYMPVAACWYRGVDSYDYALAIPAFSDGASWWEAVKLNLVLIAGIFLPFLVLYHYWQTLVFGFQFEGVLPDSMLRLIGTHLFFVAIPEEMFYRGYMQTRLDELYKPRWNIFGVMMGPGWLLTCVLFAFGHSLVVVQWWHFAIIIPSLVFGWLRSRTGGIIAGAFFHAWCNITVSILDTLYGIIPPS